MLDALKNYCQSMVPFTEAELTLLDKYFYQKQLPKKKYILLEGEVCTFLCFIERGSVRFFHTKEGEEKTCDIVFENAWVTDFRSFTQAVPCIMNLQAMEDTTVLVIEKEGLSKLYSECSKYETFGRLMAEQVAQRATDIAMSLSSAKPGTRYNSMLHSQPDLFQRIPQRYIANLLGVSPESLSRIRSRLLRKAKTLP